jgi:hypothetical protein
VGASRLLAIGLLPLALGAWRLDWRVSFPLGLRFPKSWSNKSKSCEAKGSAFLCAPGVFMIRAPGD